MSGRATASRLRALARRSIQSAHRPAVTRNAQGAKLAGSRRRRRPLTMASQASCVASRAPSASPVRRPAYRSSRGCQRAASRSQAATSPDRASSTSRSSTISSGLRMVLPSICKSAGRLNRFTSWARDRTPRGPHGTRNTLRNPTASPSTAFGRAQNATHASAIGAYSRQLLAAMGEVTVLEPQLVPCVGDAVRAWPHRRAGHRTGQAAEAHRAPRDAAAGPSAVGGRQSFRRPP